MQSILYQTINIIIGAILGITVDKFFDQYQHLGYGRYVLQLVAILLVVWLLDIIYKAVFGERLSTNNVFFISVFLGVQQSLWRNLYFDSPSVGVETFSS